MGVNERRLQATALGIFHGLSGSYERVLDLVTLYQDRKWKAWVVEQIPAGHKSVLDLGCGTLLLEERMSDQGQGIVGLDLTDDMIRIGLSKRLPNVSLLIQGDAESLPYPDATFDCVVSCYVPKYVDLGKFGREVSRVAKADAQVVLYDFARPQGLFAPFLMMYIAGGLRILGIALKMLGSPAALTFEKLPGIIEKTRWNAEIEGIMKERGFDTVVARPLTGGAVFAYCGKRSTRL